MLDKQDDRLVYRHDSEQLWIESWGPNAFRVRATRAAAMPAEAWALDEQPALLKPEISLSSADGSATIQNGKIRISVSKHGKMTISNSLTGDVLLEEYSRNRQDLSDPKCSALEVEAREFKSISGSEACHLTMRFESTNPNEKIFGMGQYQQPYLDLKGVDLELAHRNSQASVPFALSSLGYGLLWNNPSIGRAVFGKNITTFEAYSTKALDYWIVVGDTPAEIVLAYAEVTGKPPMMPEYGLGFWQCKLRYETQEELLQVAREYRRRELPLDVIVVDYFHWPLQGDWKFDERFWPDPAAMVSELRSMNIELMVSVWPTVDKRSSNFAPMLERGYLVQTERGVRTTMAFEGDTVFFDALHPAARDYVWEQARQNYYAKGIRLFWLDEAEPEFGVYDLDHFRYRAGPALSVGNLYPREYTRTFHEGLAREGHADAINLVRCAWAGSQKFGALVWSGDVASSWGALRCQLAAGLSIGIAGVPWWTTDAGGFHGGDPSDEAFRELFVRWFQWAAFCPVMRLHGDREPKKPGGAVLSSRSGADNEVWSYGPEVYDICKRYMFLREEMRPYVRELMAEAHEKGSPVMRPLFYEFPEQEECWEIGEQYMFGGKYLCCPVLRPGVRKMEVYLPFLPEGEKWMTFAGDQKAFDGGQVVEIDCPLEWMPVFVRAETRTESR